MNAGVLHVPASRLEGCKTLFGTRAIQQEVAELEDWLLLEQEFLANAMTSVSSELSSLIETIGEMTRPAVP